MQVIAIHKINKLLWLWGANSPLRVDSAASPYRNHSRTLREPDIERWRPSRTPGTGAERTGSSRTAGPHRYTGSNCDRTTSGTMAERTWCPHQPWKNKYKCSYSTEHKTNVKLKKNIKNERGLVCEREKNCKHYLSLLIRVLRYLLFLKRW